MKNKTSNDITTAVTVANAAQLVANIARNILGEHGSTTYNEMNLEENQIINLSQAVIQTEVMKRIGVSNA